MKLFQVPDLDGMTVEELREASDVFSKLASYTEARARGIELARQGDNDAAQAFGRNCKATYDRLPAWARWDKE